MLARAPYQILQAVLHPSPSPSPLPPQSLGDKYATRKFDDARRLLASTVQGKEYDEFLTTLCYDNIVTHEKTA